MYTLNRNAVARLGLASGVAMVLTMSSAISGAHAADGNIDAVMAANAQFYAALNKMFVGEDAPMAAVWSHADDATYMGPDGKFGHGWSQIGPIWSSQAAAKLGGHVDGVEAQAVAGTDIGVVSLYEQGENTNANGKVAKVRMRATNIFRLEGGKWKMIGHHTDLLPYMAK